MAHKHSLNFATAAITKSLLQCNYCIRHELASQLLKLSPPWSYHSSDCSCCQWLHTHPAPEPVLHLRVTGVPHPAAYRPQTTHSMVPNCRASNASTPMVLALHQSIPCPGKGKLLCVPPLLSGASSQGNVQHQLGILQFNSSDTIKLELVLYCTG